MSDFTVRVKFVNGDTSTFVTDAENYSSVAAKFTLGIEGKWAGVKGLLINTDNVLSVEIVEGVPAPKPKQSRVNNPGIVQL